MAVIATVDPMPSPVGHLLAGISTAWVAEALPSLRLHRLSASAVLPAMTPLVLTCAAIALAPDLDILFTSHRTITHSVGALGVVVAAAAFFARWRGWPVLGTTLACGVAFASHVFLDWLGHDSSLPAGVMALWPLSDAYYISGTDLFADVSRRYWKPEEFIVQNAWSVGRELVILVPIAALGWLLRATDTGRSPSRSSGQGGQRPPSGAAAGTGGTSDRQARHAAPP
jgi:hypothetical protein